MKTPEAYGFPEPPVTENDFIIQNDLIDYDDGCVNSLIIAAGIIEVAEKKNTISLTIREEVDGSVGQDRTLIIKLPADYWPATVMINPSSKYALMLVRVRDE